MIKELPRDILRHIANVTRNGKTAVAILSAVGQRNARAAMVAKSVLKQRTNKTAMYQKIKNALAQHKISEDMVSLECSRLAMYQADDAFDDMGFVLHVTPSGFSYKKETPGLKTIAKFTRTGIIPKKPKPGECQVDTSLKLGSVTLLLRTLNPGSWTLSNVGLKVKDRQIRIFVSRGPSLQDVGKYATITPLKPSELATIMMILRMFHAQKWQLPEGKIYDVMDFEMRGPARVQNGSFKAFFKSMLPWYEVPQSRTKGRFLT
jgi:hypothetical protein